MKRNLTVIVMAVFAAGLVAAGCGGDDDDGGDALTKQEFITQANEVCKQGEAELSQAGQDVQGGPGTPEFDAFVTDTLVPNIQGQIDDLRALGPPEADADQINGILDDAEAALGEIEADPSQLGEGPDPFAEINKELAAYGLTECAS